MLSLSAVEKAAACECSGFIDLDGRFSLCSETLQTIRWFFCMWAEFPLVFGARRKWYFAFQKNWNVHKWENDRLLMPFVLGSRLKLVNEGRCKNNSFAPLVGVSYHLFVLNDLPCRRIYPPTYVTELTSRLKSDVLMTIIYFANPSPPPERQINCSHLETNSHLTIYKSSSFSVHLNLFLFFFSLAFLLPVKLRPCDLL